MHHKYSKFYFEDFNFDKRSGIGSFRYSFDSELFFVEKISFFDNNFMLRDDIDIDLLNNLLFHLHIALGISYYKTYPTFDLVVKTGEIDEYQVDFWNKFYKHGLGEFFYRNNLDPNDYINFTSDSDEVYKKRNFDLSDRYLVPIGGGKDSITTIELLKSMGIKPTLYTFTTRDNILFENTTKTSGLDRIITHREIDEVLINENEIGAYNGHIPITGMIAFVLLIVSYLYDYKYIVLSNEKSREFGNTVYKGLEINHQWSKGSTFENMLRDYISMYISDDMEYFSLLRPFYEINIARLFARLGKNYFTRFSSCNTNFKIFSKNLDKLTISAQIRDFKSSLEGQNLYWCNNCPKCAFVYTILRPYITRDETLSIFGEELFDKKSLEQTFRELLGISGIKPFECVGEVREVVLGMELSLDKFDTLPYILEIYKDEIRNSMSDEFIDNLKHELFALDETDMNIPIDILNKLKNGQ